MEGIYVPLDIEDDAAATEGFVKELFRFFYEGPKWKGHCYSEIDEETADFLDALFARHPTIKELKMRVDRSRLKECVEAWIHVTFDPPGDYYFTVPGTAGVLTWPNSD